MIFFEPAAGAVAWAWVCAQAPGKAWEPATNAKAATVVHLMNDMKSSPFPRFWGALLKGAFSLPNISSGAKAEPAAQGRVELAIVANSLKSRKPHRNAARASSLPHGA